MSPICELGKPILTGVKNRMHLSYQSKMALISYAIYCTVHGGLFIAHFRVIGQFISGLNT